MDGSVAGAEGAAAGRMEKQGGASPTPSSVVDYRRRFFGKHPGLRGNVVVHHAVEQSIQTRYPHLRFSDAELHSLGNLRGIPKGLNSTLHLSTIRKAWNRFYKQHRRPTKQQVLAYAAEIDRTYGHLFRPPVR